MYSLQVIASLVFFVDLIQCQGLDQQPEDYHRPTWRKLCVCAQWFPWIKERDPDLVSNKCSRFNDDQDDHLLNVMEEQVWKIKLPMEELKIMTCNLWFPLLTYGSDETRDDDNPICTRTVYWLDEIYD